MHHRLTERTRSVPLTLQRRAPVIALALTSILLLGMCALAAMLIRQSYGEAIRTAENRAVGAAQTVAAQAQWLSEATSQGLQRIDDTLGTRPDLIVSGTVGNLDAAVDSLPVTVQAWVFDAAGNLILTNDEKASGPVNVADREYFRTLKDGAETAISPLITGRVSGEKVFVFSKRIDRNGTFAGVASIAVPQTLMASFWSSLDLGPDSSVSLIRDDGMIVARYPMLDETMDMSSRELFTKYLSQKPSGFYHGGGSPADGVSRIVGYYSVPGLPLVAVAGVSKDTVIAAYWEKVRSAAFIAVPIALALLFTTLLVAYLLRGYDRRRQELAEALEQNKILLREVHHRVKNNLAAVNAMVRMQSLPDDMTRDLAGRIGAMGAIHEHMYQSDRFATLDLADYLRVLATNLEISAPSGVRICARGLESVEVDADAAMPLGLMVNEVATNALKHAFPDGRTGTIAIALKRLEGNIGELQVRDDGIGFDWNTVEKGMGSRLIEGLSRQAEAKTEFASEGGTVFTARFPILAPGRGLAGTAEAEKPAEATTRFRADGLSRSRQASRLRR